MRGIFSEPKNMPATPPVPAPDIPAELRGPRVLLRPLDMGDAAAVWRRSRNLAPISTRGYRGSTRSSPLRTSKP